MKRQRNTTQMKEQSRDTEGQINEEEIGKLLEKEFRIMIAKMIKNLDNKMEKMQESITKDLKEFKNRRWWPNPLITRTLEKSPSLWVLGSPIQAGSGAPGWNGSGGER